MLPSNYTLEKTSSRELKRKPVPMGRNYKGQKLYYVRPFFKVQSKYPELKFIGYCTDDFGRKVKVYVED